METASGGPAAIGTWWYPGERTGHEFIYPKEQAHRLARGVTQPVLTTQVETTTVEQTKTADLEWLSSTGTGSALPFVCLLGTAQRFVVQAERLAPES